MQTGEFYSANELNLKHSTWVRFWLFFLRAPGSFLSPRAIPIVKITIQKLSLLSN